MLSDQPEHEDKLKNLVESGSEIAGGAVGGAIGLFGGPLGAIGGGAAGVIVGKALARVGLDVAERLLGPRERTRIGAVLAMAADEIRKRTDRGEKVRDDDFFDRPHGKRSKADEVAENVLLKAQREAEEAKIPYMARLLANVVFDKTISAELAHQIIRLSDNLTYRQLKLLRIAAIRDQLGLRASDYRGQTTFSTELMQVLYECLELYNHALVNFAGKVAFGPTDIKPASMKPQGLGAFIHNLMDLMTMSTAELEDVAKVLRS